MEEVIQLNKVNKYFGNNHVLKNIDFGLNKGQIMGLVGQSGAGKTTLIRVLLGIYKPESGTIEMNGVKGANKLKYKIGFASQEYSFYPRLTVAENMEFFGKMYAIPKKEISKRMKNLLETVELSHAKKTRAEKLSGGMKRRLDIAIALINNPEILILDEPTTGLDVVLKDKVWSLIEKINKEGITVIVSSHDLGDLEIHCKEISFIRNGYMYASHELKEYMRKHRLRSLAQVFKELYQEK